MSTAVVSGVAALVASYYQDVTTGQLKSVLLHAVDVRQSLQGKTVTGGRLNAYKAVTALLPPSELTGSPLPGGKVVLIWKDASHEEGFAIERQRSGDQFREIASVSSGVTEYTDTGLEAGTFTYRVRGFIDQAYSSYSNEVSVTVQSGAKAGGGGGGGCSIGSIVNNQTAIADTTMLFFPLVVARIMRTMRFRGTVRREAKDASGQGCESQ
jgi:hypothetical protein